MFIAHRGLVNKYNKENSIKAFKAALDSSKYIGVEVDIRETKDNYIVMVHDLIYRGKIVKYSYYKDLKGLDRLEDLLKIKNNKIMMIEIKDKKMNIEKLVRMLNKSKRNIYLMSFDNDLIKKIYKMERSFKVGVLNYVLNSDEKILECDFICLLNNIVSERLIKYFSDKGIEVFIYGIYKQIKYDKDLVYIIDDNLISK